MNTSGITATVTELGDGKFFHQVFRNGKEVAARTSKKRYSVISVQKWAGKDGLEDWAPRFMSTPIPVGRKIDYGYCAQNVAINEVK